MPVAKSAFPLGSVPFVDEFFAWGLQNLGFH